MSTQKPFARELTSLVHSPLVDDKLALGVPPPDVVDDGELNQGREDERSACAHPNIQRLNMNIVDFDVSFGSDFFAFSCLVGNMLFFNFQFISLL